MFYVEKLRSGITQRVVYRHNEEKKSPCFILYAQSFLKSSRSCLAITKKTEAKALHFRYVPFQMDLYNMSFGGGHSSSPGGDGGGGKASKAETIL